MRRDIAVIGMKRSGLHAIAAWIREHAQVPMNFVNDVPRTAELPAEARVELADPSGSYHEEQAVYTIEDRPFESAASIVHRRGRNDLLVLVIRDPLNLFASRVRFLRERGDQLRYRDYPTRCVFAEHIGAERLVYTDHVTHARAGAPSAVVVYNAWVLAPDYRRKVGAELGLLPTCEDALGEVQPYGGGSSFTGEEQGGEELHAAVLRRWEGMRDDQGFQPYLEDPRPLNAYRLLCAQRGVPYAVPNHEAR